MFDVLCLDIAGNPWRWLDIERAAHYVASGKVAWELGEGAIVLRGGVNRHGRRSELIVHPVIALARSESMVRHLRETLALGHDNALLALRDKKICAYCGEPVARNELTRDHIHPRARGGKDVWTNVVTAHRYCNMKKGCRTPEEAGMPLLYVPYAPCRFEHFLLSGRKILADQNSYLSARLPSHSRLAA